MKIGVIKIKPAEITACSEVEIFVPTHPDESQSGFLNEVNLNTAFDLLLTWDINETYALLGEHGLAYPAEWHNLKDFFQYLSFVDPVRKDIQDQDAITWFRHWRGKETKWPADERRIAQQISIMEDHGIQLNLALLHEHIRVLQQAEWKARNDGENFADGYSLQVLKQIDARRKGSILHPSIRYYGSFIGRATGSVDSKEKLNMLALPKTDWVKTCLVAREGKKILCMDMDQFEPRIVAWDIQDEFMLEQLRIGLNPYESDAAKEMGSDFKHYFNFKEERPDLYHYYKGRRNALNYGCGWKRYAANAREHGQEMNEGLAKEVIRQFRFQNPKLVAAWNYYGNYLKHNNHTGVMPLALPSGRCLYYWNVKDGALETHPDGDAPHKNPTRTDYHGPKLFENRIQAIARDIHSELCLKIHEQVDHPILHHVFDSIYLEVPETISQQEVNAIKAMAEKPPVWAPGLPLSCTVQLSDRFA